MKTNELRIGNLLNHNNGFVIGPFTVNSIHISDLERDNAYAKEYEPIPLTEEWLIEFGFKKSEWDNFNSFRLMIGNNDYTIVIYSDGSCEIGDIVSLTIQYVHQLQNLYFALTGEELNKQD